MTTPQVIVSGYASIDEAYTVSRLAGAAQTGILSGPVRPDARLGGCGPNTARALARLGVATGVVTWLGDDPQGRAYLAGLVAADVDVSGVEVGIGPSPRSLLIYDRNGDASCYFHPSGSAEQEVSPALEAQLANAAWLAIAVGPRALTEQLLDGRGSATRLAWNVKADPDAFPPELCRRLIAADLVCLNRGELAFVADALQLSAPAEPMSLVERGAKCVVLTRGADGYSVATAEGAVERPVEAIKSEDPTGAGDAFFAGVLAGLVRGQHPTAAAATGAQTAAEFLVGRDRPREEVPS
jgi:sugar/nucleoside kinase (ribokinase family)